jgi:hypothetical protein
MKLYEGTRLPDGGCQVHVVADKNSYLLPLRLDLRNHSPDGFEWGYGGRGPAQLALALAADALGDDELAVEAYQPLKWMLVAALPKAGWQFDEAHIRACICKLRSGAGA